MTPGDREVGPPGVRPQRWRRADATTVALHWIVFVFFLVSLVTGIRVSADVLDASWSRAVAAEIAPQGAVLFWHIGSACVLIAAAAGYATFLFRARQVERIRLDANRFLDLQSPHRARRWRSVNVLLYWLAYFLLISAACTGALMYSDLASRSGWRVADVHRWIAWCLVGYVLVHVVAQIVSAGWRALYAIFVPRLAFGAASLATVVVVALVAICAFLLDGAFIRGLEVVHVQRPPQVDGVADDEAWRSAPRVTIQTAGGANLDAGGTPVTIRAVRTDTDVYMLFEWRDSTRSLKHHPLQKTPSGWRMLQNGYDKADENDYYEDKFAVMLSNASRYAALRSAHMGPRPADGLPGASGQRGLHYTEDGTVLDVWHWMAVRTGPLGQAEDDYFAELRSPPDTPIQRYSGGYGLDPAEKGGSISNWKDLLEGPISRRFDGKVVPRYLPADPAYLDRRLGAVDLDPETGDEGSWWLPEDDVQPYSLELDALFPQGAVVPSVVLGTPIKGDRGDVAAAGLWQDGIWRLETRRALDTGSPYDVTISDGTYVWVAVFDHSETRHSWHLRPVRLRLH